MALVSVLPSNGLLHCVQGRGVCRRGFCQCEKGWWGKDCSRSKAYAAHTGKRLVHKLNVYAYDLPWEVGEQHQCCAHPSVVVVWRLHIPYVVS